MIPAAIDPLLAAGCRSALGGPDVPTGGIDRLRAASRADWLNVADR